MHMADALISPAVGGIMIAAAAGTAAFAVKKTQQTIDDKKIPLMGIMAAFIFAAQMINFSIPGTGSSGHLGGGLLLAIILGPYAGFLAMTSVLLIQALFFADGGLLALGCNIMNLGFFTCFITYPLIFRPLTKKGYSVKRLTFASLCTAVIGLQLGAFGVVLETVLSGKTELPFTAFVLLMQPIHGAIGIVEGIVTASVVIFVWKNRPEIIENAVNGTALKTSIKKVAVVFSIAALCTAGFFSWFASSHPDGLEWAIKKVSGLAELDTHNDVSDKAAAIQKKTAFLPDYNFKTPSEEKTESENTPETWPSVNAGTSLSGIIGGLMVLVCAALIGIGAVFFKKRRKTGSI